MGCRLRAWGRGLSAARLWVVNSGTQVLTHQLSCPVTSQQGQRPQIVTSRRLPASSCSSESRWVAWATEEGTGEMAGSAQTPGLWAPGVDIGGLCSGPTSLSPSLSTQPAWDRAGPLECLLLGPEFSVD